MRTTGIHFVAILVSLLALAPAHPDVISLWHFDEGVGGTAFDSVNGNDAALHDATWTAGLVGGGLYFGGDGDYISLPKQPLGALIHDYFSIEFWANPGPAASQPSFGFSGSGMYNTNNPVASYGLYGRWLSFGNGTGGYQLGPIAQCFGEHLDALRRR